MSSPVHGALNSNDQAVDIFRKDMADRADAERVNARHLALIDNKPLCFQLVIKLLKAVIGVFRIVEPRDDRAVILLRQDTTEAQSCHTRH